MPKRTIFKLRSNLPLIGVVSAAYYNHSETAKEKGWAAQLKVLGFWDDGLGEGDLYLPIGIAGDMVDKGFLQDEAQGEGEPDKYRVLMPNTRVQFVKEKGEGDRERVRFSIVGGVIAFEKASQGPEDAPEEPKPEEAGTAPALRTMMAEIETKYAVCLAMSAYQHVNLYAAETIHLDMRSVQAGAATMMIEMSRHGVQPSTGMLEALRERLEKASLKVKQTEIGETP